MRKQRVSKNAKSGVITIGANLNTCPQIMPEFAQMRNDYEKLTEEEKKSWYHTITLPDKHGNTLRLIQELVAIGVLDIKVEQYQKLAEIYNWHETLLDKFDDEIINMADYEANKREVMNDIGIFKSILKTLPVHHHVMTRQLGDLFADRGKQDLFNFLLFECLHANKAEYEIIYSNHDDIMLSQYERGFFKKIPLDLGGESTDRSWRNLGRLINYGILTRNETARLIETVYKPYVTLCSHDCIEDKHINFYFHTPHDFIAIKNLANSFQVEYHDESVNAIAKTLDDIELKFKDAKEKKELFKLRLPRNIWDALPHINDVTSVRVEEYPVWSGLWGRPDQVVNDEEKILYATCAQLKKLRTVLHLPSEEDKAYSYAYIFGHMGENRLVYFTDENGKLQAHPQFCSVETNLGKTAFHDKGAIRFFYCGDYPLVLQLMERQRESEQTRINNSVKYKMVEMQSAQSARSVSTEEPPCCSRCCNFFATASSSDSRSPYPNNKVSFPVFNVGM